MTENRFTRNYTANQPRASHRSPLPGRTFPVSRQRPGHYYFVAFSLEFSFPVIFIGMTGIA
jgi:hypothetical protein